MENEYSLKLPPKPIGYWILDPGPEWQTKISMYKKPTQEQIENTEKTFGWKWEDNHEVV